MAVSVFVINLDRDVVRIASTKAQLDGLGLAFERIPAVLGSALTTAERHAHYDEAKSKRRMARALSPAEIGCALSHVKVYRKMLDENLELALVLEDDVRLPTDLPELLAAYEGAADRVRPEVWLLSPAIGVVDSSATELPGGRCLRRYRSGYFTSSYLLTQAAAKALLAELYPVGDVADCWRRLDCYRVVDIRVVCPAAVEQDQQQFGSSTTDDYHEAIAGGWMAKVLYKVRRVRSILVDLTYGAYRRYVRPYGGLRFTGPGRQSR